MRHPNFPMLAILTRRTVMDNDILTCGQDDIQACGLNDILPAARRYPRLWLGIEKSPPGNREGF